jgi:Amt family ammonium transporter
LGYDDSLDAFGIHGVGGIVGALMLSFFIRTSWMTDATAIHGSVWTAFQQFGIQATAVGIAIAYAAVGTLAIIWIVDKTVGFKAKTEEELQGLDHAFHGERGYGMLNPN